VLSLAVLVPLSAVVGLVIGSFLNVVVWRLPRGESVVTPGSRCPSCGRSLQPRDNIPLVSWLLLRGRCRYCATAISVRYPIVEALTGVTFALVAWRIGADWSLPAYLYLAAVGIALACIDLDVRRLPNALTLPSYVVGAGLLTVAALVDGRPGRLAQAAIGMAALYALYFALMLAKPGGMGFGDVKLAGVLGLFLGYLGWGSLVVGAFLAFLLGGVGGVVLMVAGRAGRKTKIPFGPYMVAGAMVAVLVGQQLAHAYTHAIGL
jgi:leader peptidase (prepilin peptidase)/N-methyltransferase